MTDVRDIVVDVEIPSSGPVEYPHILAAHKFDRRFIKKGRMAAQNFSATIEERRYVSLPRHIAALSTDSR